MSSKVRQEQATKYTGARKRIRLWMMFMVLFFGWGIYTFIHQTVTLASERVKLEDNQKLHQDTKLLQTQLEQEIARLNEDEYIGQIARKTLDMYPPGETPIDKGMLK